MSKIVNLEQLKSTLAESKVYIDRQDADLSAKLAGIAEETEEALAKKLEGVKVNGAALAITDKMVDILIASGEDNGTISVNGAAIAVTGLAALAYKSEIGEEELSEALRASIAAKATAADLSALTVRVGDIEAKGYQTAADVQTAISNANHLKYEVVSAVPDTDAAKENVQYLVKNEESGHYDIYMLVNGAVELIDDTTMDLSGYSTTEQMTAAITAAIAALNIDQYATDDDLTAAVARIAALEEEIANVYTKAEVDAKLDAKVNKSDMDAYATDEEAAAAAAKAVTDAQASDEEISEMLGEVFAAAN